MNPKQHLLNDSSIKLGIGMSLLKRTNKRLLILFCPADGTFNPFGNFDFTGDMRTVQYGQHDCETVPFGTARSIYNNSYETRTFFAEARCKVPVGGLEPGGRVRSVSVSSWQ